MRKKLIGIAAATLLVISGCNAGDNASEERGQRETPNQNIEPVRFKNHDTNYGDNNRNYTLQRDLEEPRNTRNINNQNNNIRGNDINTENVKTQYDNDLRNNANTNHNRYDVAEEAANKIVKRIKTIDNAYVITTDNNAYVAAELDTDAGNRNQNRDNGAELTDDVKKQISDIVRSVDNDIDNVYVSTNPDFLDLANNYANDYENGKPIEGFFDQFGNMIERLFPQNR